MVAEDVLGRGDAAPRPPVPRRAQALSAALVVLVGSAVAGADRLRAAEASRPTLAVVGLPALGAGPGPRTATVEVDLVNRGPAPVQVVDAGRSVSGLELLGVAAAPRLAGDGRLLRLAAGDRRSLRLTYRLADCVALRRDRVDLPVRVRLSDGREEDLLLPMPTADGPRPRRPVNGPPPLRRDLSPPREWQGVLAEPVCQGSLPALEPGAVRRLDGRGPDGRPRVRASMDIVATGTALRVVGVVASSGATQVVATRLAAPAELLPGDAARLTVDYRVACDGPPPPSQYVVTVRVLDDDLRTLRDLRSVVRPVGGRSWGEALRAAACP